MSAIEVSMVSLVTILSERETHNSACYTNIFMGSNFGVGWWVHVHGPN